ncbi:hypothetical protein C8J57DRAFT_1349022 [Mycena rebaudengoi]|nr:hypothetical protein C8J57DRAFT_1349022 [Mycena rebaudengoi]
MDVRRVVHMDIHVLQLSRVPLHVLHLFVKPLPIDPFALSIMIHPPAPHPHGHPAHPLLHLHPARALPLIPHLPLVREPVVLVLLPGAVLGRRRALSSVRKARAGRTSFTFPSRRTRRRCSSAARSVGVLRYRIVPIPHATPALGHCSPCCSRCSCAPASRCSCAPALASHHTPAPACRPSSPPHHPSSPPQRRSHVGSGECGSRVPISVRRSKVRHGPRIRIPHRHRDSARRCRPPPLQTHPDLHCASAPPAFFAPFP